jgi:hypothetical protein
MLTYAGAGKMEKELAWAKTEQDAVEVFRLE